MTLVPSGPSAGDGLNLPVLRFIDSSDVPTCACCTLMVRTLRKCRAGSANRFSNEYSNTLPAMHRLTARFF
jgi:hypothetical protein